MTSRSPSGALDLCLTPLAEVEVSSKLTVATGPEPWLALIWPHLPRFAGHFVEITYSSSWWDLPCRPIFRFVRRDGSLVDRIAPAPFVGRGVWTGRIPAGTIDIAISPTHRIGRFDFKIEKIRRRSTLSLLADGARLNPRSTRSAMLTRLIGWKPESDVNLAWAIGSRPLSIFTTWLGEHARPLDLARIDKPRFDWTTARRIRLFVTGGEDADASARTLASLMCQVFPRWTACIVGGGSPDSDRIVTCASLEIAAGDLAAIEQGTVTAVIAAGDILLPQALAIVAEQAERQPLAGLFYGDAMRRQGDGGSEPVFRPGWSPRLQAARSYVGVAFVRGFETWSYDDRLGFLRSKTLPQARAAELTAATVVPLRRILVETKAKAVSSVSPVPLRQPEAKAAIIIPTRDHPALLHRIVTSIRNRTRADRYRIVIVDNGSVEPEALALLDKLGNDPDVRVVPHPGPFNFSLMCNQAAALCEGDVLVFLNDDMEILTDDWLDRLMAHAMEPATGAVGAKLTYPDGRLQHIGVLVGMGESAGHFGALAPGDDEGWAGRNAVVHEVSAVTGACLAVTRAKFDAVGGFDAEHLPIELSDIDLCLKLNARGWQTIVDPLVHLMHEESVSRGGATLRRLDIYGAQRAIFVERWRHVLRDDPAFHPGLSLYRWQAALG